jgi:hypothetical protein
MTRELLERAAKALEPMANEREKFDEIPGIIRTHNNVELWQPGGRRKCELTVGDLRQARAVRDQIMKELGE